MNQIELFTKQKKENRVRQLLVAVASESQYGKREIQSRKLMKIETQMKDLQILNPVEVLKSKACHRFHLSGRLIYRPD